MYGHISMSFVAILNRMKDVIFTYALCELKNQNCYKTKFRSDVVLAQFSRLSNSEYIVYGIGTTSTLNKVL